MTYSVFLSTFFIGHIFIFELSSTATFSELFLRWLMFSLINFAIYLVLNIIHPLLPLLIQYLILGQFYSYVNFAHEDNLLLVINYFLSIPLLIFLFYLKEIFLIASYTILIIPKIFTVIWPPKSLKDIIEEIPINNNSIKAMDLIKADQIDKLEYQIDDISIYSYKFESYSDPVYYPLAWDGKIKHCIFSKAELMSWFEIEDQSNALPVNEFHESNSALVNLFLKKNTKKLPMIETGNPLHLKPVPDNISQLIEQHFNLTNS